jgi:hypothetical protein
MSLPKWHETNQKNESGRIGQATSPSQPIFAGSVFLSAPDSRTGMLP